MKKARAEKPLTRKQYLTKFSRSARWRLGAAEAAEAIADYREMVCQPERDESKLVEELGDPVQAVWLLTDAKEYKRWLKVLAVLALGLFLCAKWAWTGMTFFRISWDYYAFGEGWRCIAVMAVSFPLSLVWFRRHGQKSGPLPKRLILALAAVGVFALGTMALNWYMLNPKFLEIYSEMYPQNIPWQVIMSRELIIDGGTICALIALAGLALARCYDRRWLAVYTLALTAAALCIMVEFCLHNMYFSWAMSNDIQAYVFSKVIPVGTMGLIGTGVALC